MVSLRDRASRPSYAALPEGLAGLSDDDNAAPKPPTSVVSDDGAESLSSGSDAYAPEVENDGKRRKIAKAGKGKEKERELSEVTSSDGDEGDPEDEEDEEGDGMDLDSDDVLTTIDAKPRRAYPSIKSTYKVSGAVSAAQAASEDRAGLVDIPPAYRAAMESMAERMLNVPVPVNKEGEEDQAPHASADRRLAKGHSKATRPVLTFIPRGTPLTWSSHIQTVNGGEKVVYRTGEGRMERKWRNGRLAISCALGTPRGGWEGEGWYPEMYTPGQGQEEADEVANEDFDLDPRTGSRAVPMTRKGRPRGTLAENAAAHNAPLRAPARTAQSREASVASEADVEEVKNGTIQDKTPTGWTLRGDVRLGLDKIGRTTLGRLSASDAELYLPTVIDAVGNPFHSILLGPLDQQKEVQLNLFDSFPTETYSPLEQGWTFHAGGPVWGLDWCPLPSTQTTSLRKQYLAISTLPHIDTAPALGEKWPRDSQGSIQIWSIPYSPPPASSAKIGGAAGRKGAAGKKKADAEVRVAEERTNEDGNGKARCEMVLCVQGGPVTSCKWMPMGAWDDLGGSKAAGVPKMGILAALQLDGAVSLYAVPHASAVDGVKDEAGPVYLNADTALLRIELPDASPMCMEWMTGSKLAVGYHDGHVAVWNVLAALKDSSLPLLPQFYTQAADASITGIAIGRIPPKDGENQFIYDADPQYIVVTSYDLTTKLIDTREPQMPHELGRTRLVPLAVAFSQHNLSPIHANIDYMVDMIKIKDQGPAKTLSIAIHRGPVWDIGTSDYHSMVVSASADGSALLSSTRFGSNRVRTPLARQHYLLYQRLFEMDYNKHTGQYRLLDSFAPESQTNEQAASRRVNIGAARADITVIKTANWDPKVAAHRVAWNDGSGIQSAGMLAIGTALGLVRVMDVRPEWYRGSDDFVQQFPK